MTTLIGIVVVFFLGYASGKVKQGKKENEGEMLVSELLKNKFHGPEYHLIDDITLPMKDGTTQIDHVLVSRKGIFVIETKHYRGWIFGDEKSRTWTQTFNARSKFSFQNPLHQNALHINECIKTLGDLPKHLFRSVVVFTGDGVLKNGESERVKYLQQLEPHINGFNLDVISQDDVFKAIGKLEVFRKERSEQTDKEHVAYLKRKHNKEDSIIKPVRESKQINWMDHKYSLITGALLVVFVIGMFPGEKIKKQSLSSPLTLSTNRAVSRVGMPSRVTNLPAQSIKPNNLVSDYQQLIKKFVVDPQQKLSHELIAKPIIEHKQKQIADMQRQRVAAQQLRTKRSSSIAQKKSPFAEISYCDKQGKNCTTKEYTFDR